MSIQPALPPPLVREPKQARSRQGWERALATGLTLLEEGGVEALSISEVCRRAAISPPSLYARVDGLTGLFTAVWQRGMSHVHATEDRVLAGLPRPGSSVSQQAADAAAAIAEVFATHRSFLRPVIAHASTDPDLLRAGATTSRQLIVRVGAAMSVDATVGREIAATLYAECVVRTMYGPDFLTPVPESETDFRARITRIARARALATDP